MESLLSNTPFVSLGLAGFIAAGAFFLGRSLGRHEGWQEGYEKAKADMKELGVLKVETKG